MRPICILLLPPLLWGCAAFKSGVSLFQADRELRAATDAGAADEAVYSYTLARAYRAKAWEEWGFSDYGTAEALARQCLSYARDAETAATYGAQELDLMQELDRSEESLPENEAPE